MRRKILLLVVVSAIFLTACNSKKEQRPEQGWLVQLHEENRDTFSDKLVLTDSLVVPPPFTWEDGRIILDLEQERFVTLGNPDVPLNQCSVFLVHILDYVGVGRVDRTTHYYAYPDFPITYAFPPGALRDTESVEIDPRSAPFIQAIESVRIYSPNAELEIRGEVNRELELSWGGKKQRIEPGESLELHSAEATLQVKELGTTGDDYIFDESFGITDEERAGLVVTKPIDYGTVTFSTKLDASFIGKGSIVDVAHSESSLEEVVP